MHGISNKAAQNIPVNIQLMEEYTINRNWYDETNLKTFTTLLTFILLFKLQLQKLHS